MSCCIIHFAKVDPALPLIKFTTCTLERFVERRKQWLYLDGEQKEVAEKSLEFLPIDQDTLYSAQFYYHKECYCKFTDKTKVERAIARSQKSDVIVGGHYSTQDEDERRPLTRSLIKPESVVARTTKLVSSRSDVLPEICIICKKVESYFTDPVSV